MGTDQCFFGHANATSLERIAASYAANGGGTGGATHQQQRLHADGGRTWPPAAPANAAGRPATGPSSGGCQH